MSRKYTPEQIEAEMTRLSGPEKKKGGRPRKYATEAEKRRAKTESQIRANRRQKSALLGIEIDEAIAPRQNKYTTDEERRLAQNRRVAEYKRRNPEKTRMNVMVRYYLAREP
jgi:hypothetical protein